MITWEEFYSKNFGLREYFNNLFVHSELLEEIIKEKPKMILEAGVGSGIMGIFLSHLGYEVSAIDNNETVLNSAKELCSKLNGKVNYILCDAFNLSKTFITHKFDIVFSQGLFEHFDDTQICQLIQEQLKVARVVMLSVPSRFYMKRDFGNERLMSRKNWQDILGRHNFKVDFIKYYGFHFPSRQGIFNIIFNPVLIYKFISGTLYKERSHLLIKIKT